MRCRNAFHAPKLVGNDILVSHFNAQRDDSREYRAYGADYQSYHRDWSDPNDGHHRDYNNHNKYDRYDDNDNSTTAEPTRLLTIQEKILVKFATFL